MNATDIISVGTQLVNSTANGAKTTASILATNTGVPDWIWIIILLVVLIWSLKGKGTSIITWGVIILLMFVIISGGLIWK